jgi:ankyrin repeat protein
MLAKDLKSPNEIDLAARSGQVNLIELFLKNGADINTKNEKGHSILMLAAYNGQYNLVEYLISQGADVNSIDHSGSTILMGVVFKGHSHIFDLLLNAGADLEIKNQKKQSALDYAIMFGRRDFIFKLNKALNTHRPAGRIEQVKTWIGYLV